MAAHVKGLDQLRDLSRWVANVPAEIQRATVAAVNATVVETRDQAAREMVGKVNLSASYIRDKMRIVRASGKRPEGAVIVQRRAVPLARFKAQQLVASAPRAKGDRSRKIVKGTKQAGVSVEVRRGQRKRLRRAFLVPLANGNGVGIFVRFGKERKAIDHLYGPGPDQLFRAWREDNVRMVQERLAAHIDAELERRFGKSR